MAGTVTATESRPINGIAKIVFTWTSSSGGAADGATAGYYTGELIRVVQVPDGGGTQPTDAYDLTLLDDDGVDVLFGLGANVSNAAASQKHGIKDGLGAVVGSLLTLHVTNAGNAKGGKTIVYIRGSAG